MATKDTKDVEKQEAEQTQAEQQEVKDSVEQPEVATTETSTEKPKATKAKAGKVYKLQLNAAHLRYIEGVRFLPGKVTEVSAEQMDKIKANQATAKLFEQKVLEEK